MIDNGPQADRMDPRNLPISDFSRWLSLVSARADDSTCEEAEQSRWRRAEHR
jgi:hypothetical protein